MPQAQLTRFATYCRSMATSIERTIHMAREDLAAARAAARTGDTVYPLSVDQALAIKCGLQREHQLWLQLAGEIDAYLAGELGGPEEHRLVDLFTPDPQEGP